ncbi:discoidin domain-containing protein [Cellulomonas sp.]|uniref:discoidin domain-containing protein n=1 Tax=Cellulomonas sp. TaxID=40001 RepID=UPI00258A6307|nr:discoidin domain-containing protein [Cellulomonas sp.]MCR6689470.1 discoidin domain-containing protein [Cellulomonas sp.]
MSAPIQSLTAPPPTHLRHRSVTAGLATLALVGASLVASATGAAAAPELLSQGKDATASSGTAALAFDGDLGTRWESASSDPQWIQVDLGSIATIDSLRLDWETARSQDFVVEVSDTGTSGWTTIHTTTGAPASPDHTVEEVTPDGGTATGRFVRLTGTARTTPYGHSLWELQVFGTPGDPVVTDPVEPTIPGTGSTLVCGRDLVNAGAAMTATASHGNAADAISDNVWARWDSGVEENPPGSGTYVGRDGEWLQIALQTPTMLCGIKPYWENAYAKSYDVLVSMDGTAWSTAAQVRDIDGAGIETTRFTPVAARYLKIVSVERGTQSGISMWDLEIFEPRRVDLPTTSLLGDHVLVFDPSMDGADIQAIMDSVFADQEEDQFGTGRWQLMFRPGEYSVDARVGFYTALAGAGLEPTDVEIHGADWVDAEWFGMNATQNFWRSAENLTYAPDGGVGRWAVSQAAPLRRVDVEGDLLLDSGRYGWSSGGFIADSAVSGYVKSWTQQQWYTRDSEVGTWAGGVWNFVYSGVEGTVSTGDTPGSPTATLPDTVPAWPTPPQTALATTGAVAEKPFLYLSGDDVDDAADWSVFVPRLRTGTSGTTWADGTDESDGASLPLTQFFVVRQGTTAAQVNAALAVGKDLLFTPGVYEMDETIQVERPGTVVLGLGLATIIPTGDSFGMHVADAAGIRVAGLLFDAAVTESPALLVVGDKDVHVDHAADPIVLNDVYMRVGGPVAGKVTTAMVVNADDTIVDHLWSWRGDHGEGIGWDVNTSDYGLVVNGDDVSAYGLFVEHYQKYNTLWKGENGRTIFYQNELPYDVPDQAAWANGQVKGWAAYKVDADVDTHEAWGLGSYSNFTADTEEAEIAVAGGFEVPRKPGVALHHMLAVSLGGEGVFDAVVNGLGAPILGSDSSTVPSYVARFPVPGDPGAGVEPPAAPQDPATNPETGPAVVRPATVTVTRPSLEYGTAGTVTVQVSAGAGATPTGTVQIRKGTSVLGSAALDATGVARVRLPATLARATHTLTVGYSGDATTSPAAVSLTVTVVKVTPRVTASAPPLRYGTAGTLTVVVGAGAGDRSGTVRLEDLTTGSVRTGTLRNGTVTFTLPKTMRPGEHVLRVRYLGSTTVAPATTTLRVTVRKAVSRTTVQVPAATVRAGTQAVLTGRITAPGVTPRGTVTIRVRSAAGAVVATRTATLTSTGSYRVVLPALRAASYTVVAQYAGSATVSASHVGARLTVR